MISLKQFCRDYGHTADFWRMAWKSDRRPKSYWRRLAFRIVKALEQEE